MEAGHRADVQPLRKGASMNPTLEEQRKRLAFAVALASADGRLSTDPIRRRASELIRLGYLGFETAAVIRERDLMQLRERDPENQPLG